MSRIGSVFTAVASATALFAIPATAKAVDITDLFNTGVDNAGTPLAAGSIDPHYTMTANDFGSVSTTSFVINANPAWTNNANSRWISVDTGDGGSINGGNYVVTYSTSFILPANTNLSSVVIQGLWAVDNNGLDILINGNSTGATAPGFGAFTAFNLPTGSYQPGVNTLNFRWSNGGGPGGLNVVFTTATFDIRQGGVGAPEPATLALLTLIAGPIAFLRRRAK